MTKTNAAGNMPATRVRPGRNEEGRLEILAAATKAFMQLGYARASIDEIADLLGATKGRVYHYYRSKADILMDIHRHVLDMMTAQIAPLSAGKTAAGSLRKMAFRHAMIVMENLAFTRVALLSTTDLFVNEKQHDFISEIGDIRRGYETLFVDVLKRGMAAGEFRTTDAKLLAKPLLGSLNWTTMWYVDRDGTDTASRERIAAIVTDYVVGGVVK